MIVFHICSSHIKIIPQAIDYFTGKVLEYEDMGLDSDEGDDEDFDDDEEEEEEEDDDDDVEVSFISLDKSVYLRYLIRMFPFVNAVLPLVEVVNRMVLPTIKKTASNNESFIPKRERENTKALRDFFFSHLGLSFSFIHSKLQSFSHFYSPPIKCVIICH